MIQRTEFQRLARQAALTAAAFVLALSGGHDADAHPPDDDHIHHAADSGSEHGSLADVGKKLSNPLGDVWALFTEFDLIFYDGDVNTGDPEVGGAITFQPILPVPIYGSGEEEWKLIIRPTIPWLVRQPVPDRFNHYDRETDLADTFLPILVSPPVGNNWILGVGPTFTLPTSTDTFAGKQQWAMGPAGVFGYKTEKLVAGVFPQYFWSLGSRGDQGSKPDANHGTFLYFLFYNLPDAWQIGFNPSITYDHTASGGNKWNVPVGMVVAKTTKIGGAPVKFQFGLEYSVVSEDDFGKRFLIKLNVIPVIKSLVRKPVFGG